MKVGEIWLKDCVKITLSTEELVAKLTNSGLEVDEVSDSTTGGKILTLKIPPNRGDLLSVLGLAREISAITASSFSDPTTIINDDLHKDALRNPEQTRPTISIQLDAKNACPCYIGLTIKNVDNSVSTPLWLKNRLEECGLRSISPIVDITNFVMLELGQPLHAFDLHKLHEKVIIRLAHSNETLKLLTDATISLSPEDLIIADAKGPLALAGIMGGADSGVSATTKDIFLESAFFSPNAIRLSARRHGLRTDSSIRFERGVDPTLQEKALRRAAALIIEISGGVVAHFEEAIQKSLLPSSLTITLKQSEIFSLLGLSPSPTEIVNILTRLGMHVLETKPDNNIDETLFVVTVPPYRFDITLPADLIEEIARVYGYNAFPAVLPKGQIPLYPMPEKNISIARIKKIFVDRGYSEVINYSFIKPKHNQLCITQNNPQHEIILQNPITEDMASMRLSLIPGILEVLQYNQRRQQTHLRFFEIGHCFFKTKNGISENNISANGISANGISENNISEKEMLALVGFGDKRQWGTKQPFNFFTLKNDFEVLSELTLTPEKFSLQHDNHPFFNPKQSASIFYDGNVIGYMGQIHDNVLKHFELEGPVFALELQLAYFKEARVPEFKPLSKFPAIDRDIAVLVDESLLADVIKSAIVSVGSDLLQAVSIFDVYQGKGVPEGKKSIAFSLRFQHPDRTLQDSEIENQFQIIVDDLKNRFGVLLRQ